MDKEYKIELGVNYFSGEGLQAHGALRPLRDILWDVTDGVYTSVEVEEHLPWSIEETGRRARRKDMYYGTTDAKGVSKLKEVFMEIGTSNYEVFLNIE